MDNQNALKVILDIEAAYYLRRSYWRYDFELYRLEEMGKRIFASGGSLLLPPCALRISLLTSCI